MVIIILKGIPGINIMHYVLHPRKKTNQTKRNHQCNILASEVLNNE